MTKLIERFRTWLATIIPGLKGKHLKKAELEQGNRVDMAPTKRYSIAKEVESKSEVECYLVTDSKEILLKPGFLVGRGASCHLRLTDPGISRVHASFNRLGDGWLLKDNSSKNGTFVNGERIRSAVLKSGDRIQIGQTLLVYEER